MKRYIPEYWQKKLEQNDYDTYSMDDVRAQIIRVVGGTVAVKQFIYEGTKERANATEWCMSNLINDIFELAVMFETVFEKEIQAEQAKTEVGI